MLLTFWTPEKSKRHILYWWSRKKSKHVIPFSLSPEICRVWKKEKVIFYSGGGVPNIWPFDLIPINVWELGDRDKLVVVAEVQKCEPFFLFPKTSPNRYMLVVVAQGLRRACWVNWWWLGRGCSLLSLDEDDLRKPLYKMWHLYCPKWGGGGVRLLLRMAKSTFSRFNWAFSWFKGVRALVRMVWAQNWWWFTK